MRYNTKIIITKNRARVITSDKMLEVGYENKTERSNYNKTTEGEKSDYSYKRALDNLILTIDSNITKYSKFITLTYRKTELNYTKALKDFNYFTKAYQRKFGDKLRYTRISERQKERGEKEQNEGSWHFHLVVYTDNYIDFETLKKCWPKGSIDLKTVDSPKNIARYFGKYFTKQKSDITKNKQLLSNSKGLKKPNIIYDIDNFVFNDYKELYSKTYKYKNKETEITYSLKEYEIN